MRLIWLAWLECARRAAAVQSAVVLHLVYYAVFGPSAALARLGGRNLLDLTNDDRVSYWIEREPSPRSVDELVRPF